MKILLVDDHILFREGLCYVLEKLTNNTAIVEANNVDQAIRQLKEHNDIDLILLDLNMPGDNGFILLDHCRNAYSSIASVVLSASKNPNDIQHALKAGAMGFIPKDSTSEVMLTALRMVMAGELYIPPLINDTKVFMPLTPRQKQVMVMIGQGLSNKGIALKLGITEATIKMHITEIFKRLGVQNRTEAALAVQNLSDIN